MDSGASGSKAQITESEKSLCTLVKLMIVQLSSSYQLFDINSHAQNMFSSHHKVWCIIEL